MYSEPSEPCFALPASSLRPQLSLSLHRGPAASQTTELCVLITKQIPPISSNERLSCNEAQLLYLHRHCLSICAESVLWFCIHISAHTWNKSPRACVYVMISRIRLISLWRLACKIMFSLYNIITAPKHGEHNAVKWNKSMVSLILNCFDVSW